uniref:Rubellidin-4.2/4.3 n=1 Tax=Litoria rubella TaxID=104895 RepID=RBE42_LITRU|nr:RecName: Full=Rubellidin-4.2/4.3 [Litoria rubella]
AGLLDILGL